jgi:hypothetical protein
MNRFWVKDLRIKRLLISLVLNETINPKGRFHFSHEHNNGFHAITMRIGHRWLNIDWMPW